MGPGWQAGNEVAVWVGFPRRCSDDLLDAGPLKAARAALLLHLAG